MNRKEQKEKTRKRLFDTSLSLFIEKGYENVSIDSIAKTAGVTKGAFYHHFISKEAILIDCINSMLNELHDNLIQKVKDEKSAGTSAVLEGIGRGIADFYCDQAPLFTMIMNESVHLNFSLQDLFTEEVSPVIAAVLKADTEKQRSYRLDRVQLAEYMATLIFLEIKKYNQEDGQSDFQNKIMAIFDMFFNSMYKSE